MADKRYQLEERKAKISRHLAIAPTLDAAQGAAVFEQP
jgi:hypothetical protein